LRLAAGAASVTGVDFVPELLAIAASHAKDVTDRVRFVQQDVLALQLGRQYDCICGSAILHEIPAASFPELLQRLKQHLRPGGFCVFLENSFFNGFYRFLRHRVVGRAGMRKVGSADETPFDRARMALIQSEFRYAERSCDVFHLFDRLWYQFLHEPVGRLSPLAARSLGGTCASIDQFVTRSIPSNRVTRYWSWLQSVYFSNDRPHL
jgi:SAM-dependent methyltransferase